MNNQITQLEKRWKENTGRQLTSQKAIYKVERNCFMGRGAFGVVYGGLRKFQSNIQQVAIKEFKRSERWSKQQDFDKQAYLLKIYGQTFDKKYVLQVIDIFRDKNTLKYYLITPLGKCGNLSDNMRIFQGEENMYRFALRMSEILKYLHYKVLQSYKSKDKANEKQKMAIIHRDVKPQNIIFVTQKPDDFYLIDFGVAKIGYSNCQAAYNNCGTAQYKAPQIVQGRQYNSKVDIYSFGCTMFEILSKGQKLLTNSGILSKYGERQRHVKERLKQLEQRLKGSAIKNTHYWMNLLNFCLQYELTNRWDAEKLYEYLQLNHYSKIDNEKPFVFGPISQKEKELRKNKEKFEINFQIFRLTVIQDYIFSMFQHVYFYQPRVSKFTLYTIIKFTTIFFLEHYSKVSLKPLQKQKKQYIENTIELRKIQELRTKCQQKIKKELDRQNISNRSQKNQLGTYQDIVFRYPEFLFENVSDPKRVLQTFCYQRRTQIIEAEKFTNILLLLLAYMEEMDSYDEMKLENNDLDIFDVEVVSLKKNHRLRVAIEDRLIKQGIKDRIDQMKSEFTINSALNREEYKTDIEIEKK